LEPEDLELLDAFISRHPEYSNRSNFARVAIRSFIEKFDGSRSTEVTKSSKSNVLTIEVPWFAYDIMVSSVRAGMYNSPEDAVIACISDRYIKAEEAIESMRKMKLEALKGTVQVIPE